QPFTIILMIRIITSTYPFIFLYSTPPPPRSTLFPYTTLFRSLPLLGGGEPAHSPCPVMASTKWIRPSAGPAISQPSRLIAGPARSEEHTAELQSRGQLVCRLLLEKKKKTAKNSTRPRRQSRER